MSGLHISVGGGFNLKRLERKGSEVSHSPASSPSTVLTTSGASPVPLSGIQITIPGLPKSCTKVPIGGIPSTAPVSGTPVRTPLTPGVRPSFGVPVPVITSVHALQNRPPVSNSHPTSSAAHSQPSAKNQVDEDYDS